MAPTLYAPSVVGIPDIGKWDVEHLVIASLSGVQISAEDYSGSGLLWVFVIGADAVAPPAYVQVRIDGAAADDIIAIVHCDGGKSGWLSIGMPFASRYVLTLLSDGVNEITIRRVRWVLR